MQSSVQMFIDSIEYFIDMSLNNDLFQALYGFLCVAFVVSIIFKLIDIKV